MNISLLKQQQNPSVITTTSLARTLQSQPKLIMKVHNELTIKAALCYVKYLISAKLQARQPLQHLLFKQSKNKSHASMFCVKYLILPLEFIAKSKAKATLKKLKTNAPSLSLNEVIADTNPDIYM